MRQPAPLIALFVVSGLTGLCPSASGQGFGTGQRPPSTLEPVGAPQEPAAAPDAPPAAADPPKAPVPMDDQDEGEGSRAPKPQGATPTTPAPAVAPAREEPAAPPIPPKEKWLEKLPSADRQALDAAIGWEVPAPGASVQFVGTRGPEEWAGKVVLFQSFTSKTSGWRATLERAGNGAAESVLIIGIHTPDGDEEFEKLVEKSPPPVPVLIDHDGDWCDALGIYRRPVNLLVGRDGNVRYAGLTRLGIKEGTKALGEETLDAEAGPRHRPDGAAVRPPTQAQFPQATGNWIGKAMPDFVVEQWFTSQPDPTGKVLVLDFWATWCPPCRAAIPHMNELQASFRNDICCVGVTDETNSNFEAGCERYRLRESQFKYALATDTQGRMKRSFGVTGIPSVFVMSSDGVVRWQGHPNGLSADVMREIVTGNSALGGGGGSTDSAPRKRWTSSAK